MSLASSTNKIPLTRHRDIAYAGSPMSKMLRFQLRMYPDFYARVKKRAKSLKMGIAEFIRQCIEQALEDMPK